MDYVVRFNGQPVHDACRAYLSAGSLRLPVASYVTTSQFRSITDEVLSYREAGSFVLFVTERDGLAAVKAFFQASARDDSLAVIRTRFQSAFGVSLDQTEADWLTMLRGPA